VGKKKGGENMKHAKSCTLFQAARVKKEFITCIQKYKDIEATFNQKYRQRVARQVRIGRSICVPLLL
jgi:syntaxin 1B/2/3